MADQDKSIWHAYIQKVAPSRKTKPIVARKPIVKSAKQEASTKPIKSYTLTPSATHILRPDVASPLEPRREKSMREGEITIDARMDLHGKTQAEAFGALQDFVELQIRRGKRTLLIITGRGDKKGGVLRHNVPGWLKQFASSKSILAIRQAAPCHGGEGALYVLLRKPHTKDSDFRSKNAKR